MLSTLEDLPGGTCCWMVTAEKPQNCQQFSPKPKNPPDFGRMGLQFDQNYSLPCFPPSTFTNNVPVRGLSPDLRGVDTFHQNTMGGFSKLLPSYWDISYPNGNAYLKNSPLGLGITDAKPIDTSGVSQRRFLIFDQSGNNTRLFFSPSLSPQNPVIDSKTDAFTNFTFERLAPLVDQEFLSKPIEEKWDENHPSDGEDDMVEDTEEINALLYSDSDDEENDEVTSTRRTPFTTEEDGPYNRDNFIDELIEEVASSDHVSPKRQRLLDGRHKKPSLVSDESPEKRAGIFSYENDVESSCAGAWKSSCGSDSNKREKKVKVRDALKILESIIPGLNTNDPLSIIDHAIVYLKSMKIEAEALGLGCPERKPAAFP